MSKKCVDKYNRWRNKNVTFRVSEDEFEDIKRMVSLSGMTRQSYFLQRLLDQKAEIIGNPRAFRGLKLELSRLCDEMKRLCNGAEASERLLDMTEYALRILDAMTSEPDKTTF